LGEQILIGCVFPCFFIYFDEFVEISIIENFEQIFKDQLQISLYCIRKLAMAVLFVFGILKLNNFLQFDYM